jgi:hypothetical protein
MSRSTKSPTKESLAGLLAALFLACTLFGLAAAQTKRPDVTLPAVQLLGGSQDSGEASGESQASEQLAAPQPYYPANQGFLGTPARLVLQSGQIIDRYGGTPVSRFFSPAGTPPEARALPPETTTEPLRTFEVLKPIDVEAGTVAPAFGQPGLGVQYRTELPLGELLEQGYVREIGP